MTPRIIPVEIDPLGGWDDMPSGPWDGEPNAARIICGDIPAVASRGPLYAWCGYLGFPQGHPAHGEDYNDHYDDWPDVHGWWTFSALNPRLDEVAGLPGLWWIGFDCSHYRDLSPSMLKWRLSSSLSDLETYRDLGYVADELCRAAAAWPR